MAPQPLRIALLLVSLTACCPRVPAARSAAPDDETLESPPASPAEASEAMLRRHRRAVMEARRLHDGPPLEGKLGVEHIKTGLAALRYPIHLCAERAEMSSGEAIAVTLEVEGESGTVQNAAIEAQYAQSEFGECVIAACRAATFARFSQVEQSFEWKLPLRAG